MCGKKVKGFTEEGILNCDCDEGMNERSLLKGNEQDLALRKGEEVAGSTGGLSGALFFVSSSSRDPCLF